MRASRIGSVNERFADRYIVNKETGCWDWIGPKTNKGYGYIAGLINGKRLVESGKHITAHRASWIIHFGDIHDGVGVHGTVVMHKCDNRGCVNPDHLMLGTQSDNVLDMVSKGRHVVGERLKLKGVDHFRSAIKDQADIDLICATKGNTKALAEKYGVAVSTIKRIRLRNGVVVEEREKFLNKRLSQSEIDFIRSTPPGTRGLAKRFGVSYVTIANIRKGKTHAH